MRWCLRPEMSVTRPAAQLSHCKPTAGWNWPALHNSHLVAPCSGEWLPAIQGEQEVRLENSPKVPSAQLVQPDKP